MVNSLSDNEDATRGVGSRAGVKLCAGSAGRLAAGERRGVEGGQDLPCGRGDGGRGRAQRVHVAVGPADQVVGGVGAGVQAVGGGQGVGDRLGLHFGGAAVGQVVEVGVGVPA